jgi:hypothetical protein
VRHARLGNAARKVPIAPSLAKLKTKRNHGCEQAVNCLWMNATGAVEMAASAVDDAPERGDRKQTLDATRRFARK